MPGQNTETAILLSASSKRSDSIKPDNTELRGRIHAQLSVTQEAGQRRCGDHRAALAMRLDTRQERVDGVEHAVQVDAHAPIPIVVARLADAASPRRDARVRNDDVHLAEVFDDLVRSLLECRAIGDVDIHRVDPILVLLEVRHGFIEIGFRAIGDRDLHPRCNEGSRDAEANAAIAPRDEGHFASDVFHRC